VTARIINGTEISKSIRIEVARGVAELRSAGVVPGLAAVLVGDDPASAKYVESIKGRACTAAGIQPFIKNLPGATSEKELLRVIESLNDEPEVHGIIVQLPLPGHLDPMVAQSAIDPAKDVDGLHPQNAGLLALGRPRFVPCTPLGVKVMLERAGAKVEGAEVVVVGRSNLVGRPLSILLSQKEEGANATVTLCHTGTVNLEAHTRDADILVVAAGTPRAITGQMVKPGAVVIDVGINATDGGKLVGDVDFDSVSEVAGAITPVPGGVGPMTVAMLLSNTVQAARAIGSR
jgi:methylenetetrahydrofolate dehydrogenase (NADP+)/methenyltetrahydrofolate cyclohydrolase